MTALESWTITLRCPHCGRTGTGTVFEEDAEGQGKSRLRIDQLSNGFIAVELHAGARQDIRCAICNSSALK
jgi:phage FluMu protein Com